MQRIPKVAVLLDTTYAVRRDFLLGVSRYAREHGPWSLWITDGEPSRVVPRIHDWGGHGIIGRLHDEVVAKAVLQTMVPTIALCVAECQNRDEPRMKSLSDVTFDAAPEVARLAFEHFLARQLKHFAYVGVPRTDWSIRRETAFANAVRRAGFEVQIYPCSSRGSELRWESEQKILTAWIDKLPKPIGILAGNDHRGRQVLEACRLAGAAVPEQVAVIGVDNDETFCDVADPPLSSIALGATSAGYRAAELLDGLMRGDVKEPQKVNVQATRVVTRRSTEHFAVDDTEVAAALRYIQQRHGQGISVMDVASDVAISRRNLEKRFHRVLGRTVLEEIQRVRLEYAKQLLLETEHPVSLVASLSGFGTISYFARFFRERTGLSPAEFRHAALNTSVGN